MNLDILQRGDRAMWLVFLMYNTPWSGFMGCWNMGAKFVCPLKIGGKFTSQELTGNVSWQFISHELTFPEIMILGNSYSRVRAYFKT